MTDKIKVKISLVLSNILDSDAINFFFVKKNNQPNRNAFVNKLIPTLVEMRKAKRNAIEKILSSEYCRNDSENIYNAVNTVIDRVYFYDDGLGELDEYLWIRPTKENIAVFNEIENSECRITAQELSVYIRGLLNEYACLPTYKRGLLTFDKELDVFSNACLGNNIIYFTDRETGENYRAFAYNYYYGYLYDQTNYCVIYDINNKVIKSVPLHRMANIYAIKKKYHPNDNLVELLQNYSDDFNFDQEILVEDK